MDVGMSLNNPGFQSLAEEHVFSFFEPFCSRLPAKCKKAIWLPVLKNDLMILDAFITNCKSFRPTTFCELFCYVFNGFEIRIKLCVFMIPYTESLHTKFFLFLFARFASFKAKRTRNGSKNEKPFFINVS